jgi:pyrimidine-specific ribonucleoside hydrolase
MSPLCRRQCGGSALTRRSFVLGTSLAACGSNVKAAAREKRPVIDVTDLYHPHQDVGDNFDLIAAFALPEVDLRGVVLDVTQRFRDNNEQDRGGPRDPGVIPVTQLNYLFDRNVPYGIGPFSRMKSPEDPLLDAPAFQQTGIQLILDTLRQSREPVDLLSFGSGRPIAAAYNRAPRLLRRKLRRLHLCAGATAPDFIEWNVALDPLAIVRLLKSDLPIAIYPCATKDGPFAYDEHNSFWRLPDLEFVREMDPALERYLVYAFERSSRIDFLRVLDGEIPKEGLDRLCRNKHNVWETAVWAQVADRKLVRKADGTCRLVPSAEARSTDRVLPGELRPCRVEVRDSGGFVFSETSQRTNFSIYYRGDPKENEAALRQAVPALYRSFATPATRL